MHYVGSKQGNWATIVDAIAHAGVGDRIEIGTGTYNESIVVSKPLEIVNAEGENPEIMQWGTAITLCSMQGAYLCGLEVVQNDKGRNNEASCVIVQEGSPIITQCRFPSLLVTGNASPFVESNEITGSQTSGIKLRARGGGNIENNNVYNHTGFCVDLGNSGDTTLKGNRLGSPEGRFVKKGKGVIYVAFDSGSGNQPKFIENRISDPQTYDEKKKQEQSLERPAVTISTDTDAVFQDNDFINCEVGVLIDGSSPLLQDNSFTKMATYGVKIVGGSPALIGNRFMECHDSAVHIKGETSSPTLQENVVHGYNRGGNGFVILDRATPRASGNSFTRIQKVALKIHSAGGVYDANVIDASSGPAMMVIGPNAVPALTENQILRGEMQGLVIVNHAAGVYTRNEISSTLCGIVVLNGSTPEVVENVVSSCQEEGIVVAKGSQGLFRGNSVQFCLRGFIVTNKSRPVLRDNIVMQNTDAGIHITDTSNPILEGNSCSENKGCGVEVLDGSDPHCTGNKLTNNHSYGIDVKGDTFGTYLSNTIQNNSYGGVRASEGAYPVFRGNYIGGGSNLGVLVERGAYGIFEKNRVCSCQTGISVKDLVTFPVLLSNSFSLISRVSVEFNGESKGVLRSCNFSDVEEGIHITGMSLPTIERNRFDGAVCAIRVSGKSTQPYLTNNCFVRSQRTGIMLENCKATIINNVFEECNVGVTAGSMSVIEENNFIRNSSGVKLIAGSVDKVWNNSFTDSTLCGIAVTDGAEGVVTTNSMQGGACAVLLEGATGPTKIFKNKIINNENGIRAIHDDAQKGQALVTENTIEGCSQAGFFVEEHGHMEARVNTVKNSEMGLFVRSSGHGLFEDNTFTLNNVATKVINKGQPLVRKCILQKSDIGILVTEGGRGEFIANTFNSNATHIQVENGGNPRVSDSDLSESSGSGLIIKKGAKGIFHENRFCGNQRSGVEIETGSDPIVERNEISNNMQCGVLVCKDAFGQILNNQIYGNGASGVCISTGSRPVVEKNDFYQNREGVLVETKGFGVLTENEVHGNRRAGVCLREGADPCIEKNTIHSECSGLVFESCKGTVTENEIYNCQFGCELISNSFPVLNRNVFKECTSAAYVSGSSVGIFRENRFIANKVSMEIVHKSSPQVDRNYFAGTETDGGDCEHIGVSVISGCPLLTKNTFTTLITSVLCSSCDSFAKIRENMFTGSITGLRCTEASAPQVDSNEFQNHLTQGVYVEEGAAPKMAHNTFQDEEKGLVFENGGGGVAEKNSFNHNQVGCFIGGSNTAPELTQNNFTENQIGVLSDAYSTGCLTLNLFVRNSDAGVSFQNNGDAQLIRNSFVHHDMGAAGVRCSKLGRGRVMQNLFTQNLIGVHLQKGACTVTKNLFCVSGQTAILSSDYAAGDVVQNAFRNNTRDVETRTHGCTKFELNSFEAAHTIFCHDCGSGHFSNNVLVGRCVSGGDSYPKIENNHIQGLGILFEKGSRGEVLNNIFSRMNERAVACVEVKTGAAPEVIENQFWKCPRSVYIHDDGEGQFYENRFLCGRIGVEVGRGAPQVGEGNLFEGLDRAILSTGENSCGEFKGIIIQGSSIAGVWTEKDARPSYQSCEIYDCRCGVHVLSGKPEFLDCDVFDNSTGIQLDTHSAATLRNNRVFSYMEAGALLKADGALVVFDGNNVRHQFSPLPTPKRPCRSERNDLRRKVATKECKKVAAEGDKRLKELQDMADAVVREVEDLFKLHRLDKPDLAREVPAHHEKKASLHATHPSHSSSDAGNRLSTTSTPSKRSLGSVSSRSHSEMRSKSIAPPISPIPPKSPLSKPSLKSIVVATTPKDIKSKNSFIKPKRKPEVAKVVSLFAKAPKKRKSSLKSVVFAKPPQREKPAPPVTTSSTPPEPSSPHSPLSPGSPKTASPLSPLTHTQSDVLITLNTIPETPEKEKEYIVSHPSSPSVTAPGEVLEMSSMEVPMPGFGGCVDEGDADEDDSRVLVVPVSQSEEVEVCEQKSSSIVEVKEEGDDSYVASRVPAPPRSARTVSHRGLSPNDTLVYSIMPLACDYRTNLKTENLFDTVNTEEIPAWDRWCDEECRIFPAAPYSSPWVAQSHAEKGRRKGDYIEGIQPTPTSPSHWRFAAEETFPRLEKERERAELVSSPTKGKRARRAPHRPLPQGKHVVSMLSTEETAAAALIDSDLPLLGGAVMPTGDLVSMLPSDMVTKKVPPLTGKTWVSSSTMRVRRTKLKPEFIESGPLPEMDLDRLKLTAPGLIKLSKERYGLPVAI